MASLRGAELGSILSRLQEEAPRLSAKYAHSGFHHFSQAEAQMKSFAQLKPSLADRFRNRFGSCFEP